MKYSMGIDIGGTNIRACVIDEEYNIVDKFKMDNKVAKGPIENIDNLLNEINKRWSEYKIESIGIASPGPLDLKEGIIINPPNLLGWENFELKKYFEEKFDLPIEVNNDANLAGYGEAIMGAAKGCESVYYITLSTGVGGGFIYKNQIVNGFNNVAAEINNMFINDDDFSHNGLNKGGLEGQCSGGNISRIANEKLNLNLSTREVFERAASGDEICKQVMDTWVVNISRAILNIIVTVDPEAVVLGGSVILNNSDYLERIREEVKKYVFEGVNVDIRLAELGDDAGLIGAGILANSAI